MLAAGVGFSPWSSILFPVVSHHYVNLVLENQVYDYNSVLLHSLFLFIREYKLVLISNN